ncbi:MAG: hypothetical protein MJ000_09120 [Bacteroidales bacterium]|nr:hypothetical protein [Bacteroidales bacterium]
MSNYEEEGAPIGLKIISFLIPIVGWVCYFIIKDDNITKAKDCSKFAWIGFAVAFVLGFIGGLG